MLDVQRNTKEKGIETVVRTSTNCVILELEEGILYVLILCYSFCDLVLEESYDELFTIERRIL